jgi:signal transduction histidine kinase
MDPAPASSQASPPASARQNKLELVERLAEDLAHEIKNPLHSMVINLEVLKRRVARAAGDDADAMRYIEVLSGELDRVGRRIDLLLQLARPLPAGGSCSLDETLAQLEELLQVEAGQHRVAVEMGTGAPFVDVPVPRPALSQLLLNVILHAVDAAGRGGTVRLRSAANEAEARVEVEYDRASAGNGRPESPHPLTFARESASRLGVRLEAAEDANGTGRITLGLDRTGGAPAPAKADRA